MTIPKVQAGEIGMRFRQPFFFALWSVPALKSCAARSLLPFALGLVLVPAFVTAASAQPARLLTARFSGNCDGFTIKVTGDGLHQPNPTVSYNIKLTPPSGEPLIIVDSSPVTPEKNGKFHKTVHGTWKKFEFTLTDAFTLSGSAILISDLTLLHTAPVTFSRATLTCSQKR